MRVPVSKTFIPKEAHGIAAKYEKVAKELREIADQVNQLMNSLENSWEGNAKQRFFADYGSEVNNLRATADFCSECGKKIWSMTVTTTEWKDVSNPWQS
jgi:uncharacterized protein YukE